MLNQIAAQLEKRKEVVTERERKTRELSDKLEAVVIPDDFRETGYAMRTDVDVQGILKQFREIKESTESYCLRVQND